MNSSEKRMPKKPGSSRPLPIGPTESVLAKRIADEQECIHKKSLFYKYTYFSVRLVAGIAAAVLPFFVTWTPTVAIVLSVLVSLATVIDSILKPFEKWKNYSNASDALFDLQAQKEKDYSEHKPMLQLILDTNKDEIGNSVDLSEVMKILNNQSNKSLSKGEGDQG